jgi:hypothetical protein
MLPYKVGEGCYSGSSLINLSFVSVTTQSVAFKYVIVSEPYRPTHLIFKTGHGRFTINSDYLFLNTHRIESKIFLNFTLLPLI